MPDTRRGRKAELGEDYKEAKARMPRDTYERVEAEAERRGWTVSRMLLALVTLGLSEIARGREPDDRQE